MVKVKERTDKKVHLTRYEGFRGVDFSTDETMVAPERSPMAENMVADRNGYPEKRCGWRTLFWVEAPVNGIFYAELSGTPHIIIHGGTKLYRWQTGGEPVCIREGVANHKSTMFCMNNKIWILTGTEYLVFDGTAVKNAYEGGYIPTTTVKKPAGRKTGGEPFESINLCSKYRAVTYKYSGLQASGIAVDLYLDSPDGDLWVDGNQAGQWVYYMSPEGEWRSWSPAHYIIRSYQDEEGVEHKYLYLNDNREYYTLDLSAEETFKVIYPLKQSVIDENIAFIASNRYCACFGAGQNNRVFMAGSPSEPNVERFSRPNDPTWFPAENFKLVGSADTPVLGFSKVGEYLAVHKKDNMQDTTLYLQYAEQKGGAEDFPLRPVISGIGAVGPEAFCTVNDELLLMTKNGVFSIVSVSGSSDKTARNRSFYIDSRLTAEQGLEGCTAGGWGDLFLVAVNGRAYALDTKLRSYVMGGTSHVYDGYYWTNIPARLFSEVGDVLYFGTEDGRVCRFNTDLAGNLRFNDDGAPIRARIATKADDDGSFMLRKTMPKRGSGIMIKPYARGSVSVYAVTEKGEKKHIGTAIRDIFSWTDFRFDRISFDGGDSARVIPLNCKVKNYLTLQFILENKELNEGFGVFGIEKRYVTGAYERG